MIHVDSFSGCVSNLKPGRRDIENLVRVLSINPRVSVWDMSELKWLRDLINQALYKELIILDDDEQYPWLKYQVVEIRFRKKR